MERMRRITVCLFFSGLLMGLAAPAFAVDGVNLISPPSPFSCAAFPIKITTRGSYRLAGNLSLFSCDKDAISISVDDVTLDLNGFSITGNGGTSDLSSGVNGNSHNRIIVQNGSVVKMSDDGVNLGGGTGSIVRGVTASYNYEAGIEVGDGCTISGNTTFYDWDGIEAGGGCVITGNTVNGNGESGIGIESERVPGGTVSNNTANGNGSDAQDEYSNGVSTYLPGVLVTGNTADFNNCLGLEMGDPVNNHSNGYSNNVMIGNGCTDVFYGTSLGAGNTNLCSGGTC